MNQTRELVLASASPRRREILHKLGLRFEVLPSDVDESRRGDEDPVRYVARLAEEKARAALPKLGARPVVVLAADTTVVLDGEILNKPRDLAESERMLRALRGREHLVHTALSALLHPEDNLRSLALTTRVRFRAFDDATLHGYVASREGMDKAGAYGIQELGAALVSEVHGSYGSVVGLPAAETIELLAAVGALSSWP